MLVAGDRSVPSVISLGERDRRERRDLIADREVFKHWTKFVGENHGSDVTSLAP